MVIFFFLSVVSVAISILIFREFKMLASRYYKLNKELEKYNSKNKYEIKKLFMHIKKCDEVIKSSETIEEKIHWYNLKIEAYESIEKYSPEGVMNTIESKINKNKQILYAIEQKLIDKKGQKKSADGNMGVA